MKFLAKWCWVFIAYSANGVPISTSQLESDYLNSNIGIRVLLARLSHDFAIQSSGKKIFYKIGSSSTWKKTRKKLNISAFKKKRRSYLRINGRRLPSKSLSIRTAYPSESFTFLDRKYRGTLHIHRINSKYFVVNEIELNQYIVSILHGEMSPSWEIEALKAQAVASRSYALNRIRKPKSKYYDVEGSIMDQVYLGDRPESERIRLAVHSTRGKYVDLNGKPARLYFHSRCGGKTEDPKWVWNVRSNRLHQTVACPYCQKNPYHWKARIPQREVLSKLKLPKESNTDMSIRKVKDSKSGRITSLSVEAGNKKRKLRTQILRKLLGFQQVKSTRFKWKIDRGQVEFEGVGSGHGVGMCQWGARHLAKIGYNYRRILKHYYSGAQIHG